MEDIIERMESAAESGYYEMTKDVPAGKLRCSCANIDDEDNFELLSSNPYAMPSCSKCCEAYFKLMKNVKVNVVKKDG